MVGSTAVLDEGLHAGQAKQTGPEDVCAEEGPYPAQPCGAAQQPPDGVFGQVEEQAFGQPHGATGFVETCVLECRLPPPAEISTDLPALASGVDVLEHSVLGREDVGVVQLEHHRVRGPVSYTH